MKYQVKKKQNNSKMCFVCGLKNDFGLHASFYETEANELVGIFTAEDHHQGYPGRLHGGIAATILDETIGRSIDAGKQEQQWNVTIELATKFRKPIPVGVQLKVVGRVTQDGSRIFEGSGEIILPDGEVAVTATGRFMKIPFDKITEDTLNNVDWFRNVCDDDPVEIDITKKAAL